MKHLLLAVGLLGSADLFAQMPKGGVCAHQGDNADFPANTVPAFKSAAEKGAAMVEMDVKRCATGELVILHDSTVDRTTNGTGEIARLTFKQIRALDAGVKKNPKFAGTKVPTFDEAIDGLPKDGIWINVHCADNVAGEVAKKIKEKGRLHQAFIAASLDAIERARKVVPEILSCNMNRTGKRKVAWTREQSTLYATQTVDHRCNFLQLITPCSAGDVKLLHDAGAKINYFGCNDPARLQDLLDLGVDFILTDRLDVIQTKYKELKGNHGSRGK